MAWDPGTLLAASESESESSESSPRSSSGMPSAASAWSLLGRNRKRCNRPAHPSSSHISSSHPSLSLSLQPLGRCSASGATRRAFCPSPSRPPGSSSPPPARAPAGSVAASLCRSLSAASAALGTPGRHPLPTQSLHLTAKTLPHTLSCASAFHGTGEHAAMLHLTLGARPPVRMS